MYHLWGCKSIYQPLSYPFRSLEAIPVYSIICILIPGKIIKIIHDDSHEQVQHEKAAEKDKADKEDEGHVGAAGLTRIQQFTCNILQKCYLKIKRVIKSCFKSLRWALGYLTFTIKETV